jgi:hypothetical protein
VKTEKQGPLMDEAATKLKLADEPENAGLTDEEARRWLGQPVTRHPAGRTIITKEVASA